MSNGRCQMHGGKALSGPSHPNFKTGKYSKFLRRDLLNAYADSLSLEDPYSMRDELALLDARLAMLAQGLPDSDGVHILEEVFSLKSMFIQTENDGDVVDVRLVIDKMDQIIGAIQNERRQWQEIYDVVDHRRRLVESERKREVDAQRMISEHQALVIISLLVNIIRKHVSDQSVLNSIAAELNGLTDWKAGRFIESQSG